MKVVVRCIYYKPVTPSCDIVEMDWNTWREFLYAKEDRRIEIVLKLLGHEYMEGNVRQLAWIPLDEHIRVTIKKNVPHKKPAQKPIFTQEQIETFRKKYQEECSKINEEQEYTTLTAQEMESTFNRLSDDEIRYLLEIGSSPESRAYIEMCYGN